MRSAPVLLRLSVAGLLTLCCGVAAWGLPAGWNIQTLDSDGSVGLFNSIALDSSDNPYISYFDGTNYDLKYAAGDAATRLWTLTTIESTGNVGGYTSLVIDGADTPHIGYRDADNENPKYAVWNSGTSSWDTETVADGGSLDWGRSLSLAVDASGTPQMSYYDYDNSDLRFAKWNSATSSWDDSLAYGNDWSGFRSSMALDSNGNPHISFRYNSSTTPSELKYASWNATTSAWDVTTVDSGIHVGAYNSLAIDSSDTPHIGYYDYNRHEVKYATWNSTASLWDVTTVEDKIQTYGMSVSIAVDGNDRPHMVYRDILRDYSTIPYTDDVRLRYAALNTGTSAWDVGTIEEGDFGWDTSLVIDSEGRAHVSYYDQLNDDLKYARATPELSSGMLLLAGMLPVGFAWWRRRRQ